MAQIKNKTNSVMRIARQKVKPGGVVTVEGKISGAVWNLHDAGALEVTGADREKTESSRMVATDLDNPSDAPAKKSDEQVASENDQAVIDVMKKLPPEAMMADGRPEVRAVNDELKKLNLNNVTAEDRDRLWAQAQKES